MCQTETRLVAVNVCLTRDERFFSLSETLLSENVMLRFCPFSLKIMEKPVEVREATREDCREIRQLIQELADFEDMSNNPKISYQVLEKDGFDRETPLFGCYVAVCEGKVIGYALYFYIYTTLERKAIFLEDFYVTPEFRKKRIGSRLFDSVAKRTFDEKCEYMGFSVLAWNPAQGFYKAKGAVNLTEVEGWRAYRITRDNLPVVAKKLSGSNVYTVREATSDDYDSIRRLAEDAFPTQNVRISKYKKTSSDAISVINVDEKICVQSDDFYGYFVVELDNKVVAYSLYCYSYSTWDGKSMYLQELYVPASEHSANMRLDLFALVSKKAHENGCGRMDFWVLDWKNLGPFYMSHGAVDLTETEEWNMYRLFEMKPKAQ